MRKHDEKRDKRHALYNLCIIVVMCITAGRICSVTSELGTTAFQSANDRSRWCTVASLVEDGTYEIDRVLQNSTLDRHDRRRERQWTTIDMVRHRGDDGKQHYYSSKPPLFPTMVAAVYWGVYHASGLSMSEQPIYVPRIVLLIVNLPLLLLFLWCTIGSIDLVASGDWPRQFAAVAVCFGTMLTAFAISLNNHLPAAACTALVMYLYFYAAEKLDDQDAFELRDMRFEFWLTAGLAAGFVVANELPALCMLVLWFGLIYRLSAKAVIPFAVGVVMVAGAFFLTNYIAHGSIKPAYAHRGNGPLIATIESASRPPTSKIQRLLIQRGQVPAGTKVTISDSDDKNRRRIETNQQQMFALIEQPDSKTWSLNQWDDWYDYPGSHWIGETRKGVDRGEPSRLVYLFNMTFGFYGLFSLTPLWLLLPLGLKYGLKHGPRDYRRFVAAVGIATLVCLLFYLMRPEIDRNYGGVSACFRWMLWFAPLWFAVIAPMLGELSVHRRHRRLLLACLGASVFSVSFAWGTPWQSPWIYQLSEFLGWIAK